MKNIPASSNQPQTDRPVDSQPAASLFQIARAVTEPSRFRWEALSQIVCGACVAATLWLGIDATAALRQSGGMERFAIEALRPVRVPALEQSPVAANTPAPANPKKAPAYL